MERSWLRDYVSKEEIANITEQIGSLTPEAYGEWTFHGQPIGELVRNSVAWFLRKSRPTLSGRDTAVFRDFLVGGTVVALLAPRLLSAVRPEVVLELNGQFFAERVFNQFAREQATVIAYEAGWRKDTLGFDRVSPSGPVNVDDVWPVLKDRPLSPVEARELDTWIEERTAGELQRDFYIRFTVGDLEDPLLRLGLDPFKPTAVLFSNLVWDTAVFGRDAAFATIQEWVEMTVDLFRARPDRQLIIRIHPAEELRPSQASVEKIGALVERIGPLPMNIRVVRSSEQMNSYLLMERCQVGLVYTTTAGLEMALRGKPVVVAARVYYRGRRFTLDVERADEYPRILDRAFEMRRMTDQEIDLARRFAHLLLFRYLHRFPVVRQRPRRLPILDPSEAALLLPGASADVDRLLDAILCRGELVRMDETRSTHCGQRK